jgi:hypothetical protein
MPIVELLNCFTFVLCLNPKLLESCVLEFLEHVINCRRPLCLIERLGDVGSSYSTVFFYNTVIRQCGLLHFLKYNFHVNIVNFLGCTSRPRSGVHFLNLIIGCQGLQFLTEII